MKALYYERFGGPVTVADLPDPEAPEGGAVIRVEASGLCRSDWHAWVGHDDTVRLPHVPGHEFAGVVAAVGADPLVDVPGEDAGRSRKRLDRRIHPNIRCSRRTTICSPIESRTVPTSRPIRKAMPPTVGSAMIPTMVLPSRDITRIPGARPSAVPTV